MSHQGGSPSLHRFYNQRPQAVSELLPEKISMANFVPRILRRPYLTDVHLRIWKELHHQWNGLIVRDVVVAHVQRSERLRKVIEAIGAKRVTQALLIIVRIRAPLAPFDDGIAWQVFPPTDLSHFTITIPLQHKR